MAKIKFISHERLGTKRKEKEKLILSNGSIELTHMDLYVVEPIHATLVYPVEYEHF